MKDPFDLFIEDSVYTVNDDYYKLMYKTKFTFFDYLNKNGVNAILRKESKSSKQISLSLLSC